MVALVSAWVGGVFLGFAVAFCLGLFSGAGRGGSVRRMSLSEVEEEELLEVGRLDKEGAVARAVPWICRTMRDQATDAAAYAKPYDDGYGYALARAAGRMSAFEDVSRRWEELLALTPEELVRRRKLEVRGKR